jgi:hypothetical protein
MIKLIYFLILLIVISTVINFLRWRKEKGLIKEKKGESDLITELYLEVREYISEKFSKKQ